MTDDLNAISGAHAGYVPCDEVALAQPASGLDAQAVYGDDEGFVPKDGTALADIPEATDTNAVFGQASGYVAGPCADCTSLISGVSWNQMDLGSMGTSWVGTRVDQTDPASFSHQSSGSQTTGGAWVTTLEGTPSHTESENRSFASVNVTSIVGAGATHVRLNATLRNYIGIIHEAYVIGNEAPVDWELVAGNWGTGTPTWDDGTVIASGTIPASTAFFDDDGLVVVPIESTSFTSPLWALTGDYAQWYFRNTSATGYLYSLGSPANGHAFTASEIDVRYPNETFTDPFSPINWDWLRSQISLQSTIPSSAFEDWTLDVYHCT